MRRHVPALVLAVLALVVVGSSYAVAGGRGHHGPDRHETLTLLQMNQCLSGYAGCFGRTAYPAVVDETVDRIDANDADVVVLNESCSEDAARMAAETGLHLTFSTVIYRGAPLACKTPEGRGEFGNAVLTREPAFAVRDAAYGAQEGVEERRATCVVTEGLTVCGTHLSTRGTVAAQAASDAQCAELRSIVEAAARIQPVVAAGDVNRQPSCAPRSTTTVTDAAAAQAPGIQHVYGDRRLGRPRVEVEPATYTDHDVLVVRYRVPR